MSRASLTPNVYRQGMKWSLATKNKIDSVIAKFTRNKVNSGSEQSVSVDITNVLVNGISKSLPLASTELNTNTYSVSNEFLLSRFAEGTVQVVLAQGTTNFIFSNPVTTFPTVTASFEGTSKRIEHNSANFNFDWYHNNLWDKANATNIIDTNATDSSQSLSGEVDYTQSSIPLYPFVKKLMPAKPFVDGTTAQDIEARNQPTSSDIITQWCQSGNSSVELEDSYNYADANYWSSSASANSVRMWSSTIRAKYKTVGSGLTANTNQQITLDNNTFEYQFRISKISDYEWSVDWSLPVRYTYFANTRKQSSLIFTMSDIDTYAFIDYISKITLTLSTAEIDMTEETQEYIFNRGIEKKFPFNFESNELLNPYRLEEGISKGTLWHKASGLSGYDAWFDRATLLLQDKYELGKFTVECTVPIYWILENNININSDVQVMLPNGEYIHRVARLSFKVKQMEFNYKNSDFTCSIKLLEDTTFIPEYTYLQTFDDEYIQDSADNYLQVKQ